MKTGSRRVKIVCTLGPATASDEILTKLIEKGLDVARINMSHGTHQSHADILARLRKRCEELGRHVGIMIDLQGPKIRLGNLEGGTVELQEGNSFILDGNKETGNSSRASISMPEILDDVTVNDRILFSDGEIELAVREKRSGSITLEVLNSGSIRDHAGVNFPDSNLTLPALMSKDIEDIHFGVLQDVDFISLSFVRRASDLHIVKDELSRLKSTIPVIAKIEKPQALVNLDEIIELADGIMIARGDLGVEMNPEQVPKIQKEITSKCNMQGKVVITATQMLNSMIESPRPTRAEASDVANAILDGTDAVMLSGETSIGKYPLNAVDILNKIAVDIESSLYIKPGLTGKNRNLSVSQSIAESACTMADELQAKAIVVITHSGATAEQVSRYRPQVPIIAITASEKVVRRLKIVWGIEAILIASIAKTDECLRHIAEKIQELPHTGPDDKIIITAGIPTLEKGSTNSILVWDWNKKRNELF